MEAENATVDQLHREIWTQTNAIADLLAGMDSGVGAVSDWQREIVRIDRTLEGLEMKLGQQRSADPGKLARTRGLLDQTRGQLTEARTYADEIAAAMGVKPLPQLAPLAQASPAAVAGHSGASILL